MATIIVEARAFPFLGRFATRLYSHPLLQVSIGVYEQGVLQSPLPEAHPATVRSQPSIHCESMYDTSGERKQRSSYKPPGNSARSSAFHQPPWSCANQSSFEVGCGTGPTKCAGSAATSVSCEAA